jgi:hypothetical protein
MSRIHLKQRERESTYIYNILSQTFSTSKTATVSGDMVHLV